MLSGKETTIDKRKQLQLLDYETIPNSKCYKSPPGGGVFQI